MLGSAFENIIHWPGQRYPLLGLRKIDQDVHRAVLAVARIDLDSIRNSLESIGGHLVLCSFEWLAEDGMPLSPTRHQYIYRQLNTVLWPLRYADIRRLADFQNRVFRRYALMGARL